MLSLVRTSDAGIVRRIAADAGAGRDEHDVEAVAARDHRLEDRAAADLGAAAEHRFDRDGALG